MSALASLPGPHPTPIDELLDTQAAQTPEAPSQLSQNVTALEANLKATLVEGEHLVEDVIDKAKELFN